MNTKHLFARTGKKSGRFFGFIIGILVALLLSWGVCFATSGSVTGTITRASDNGALSGLYVNAYDAVTGAEIAGSSASAANGSYTISGLPPGNYKIMCQGNGTYSMQYYLNAANIGSATPVTVTSGATTTGINFSLATGGFTITGTITRASDNAVLPGLTVYAYDATTSASITGSSVSASDGSYTIPGLLPGSYAIKFRGNTTYAQQYYNNAPDWYSSTPVTITTTSVTNINFSLVPGGNITGTITSASVPVSGVYVYAFDAVTLLGSYGSSSVSASNGSYTISGLLPGNYKVRFNGNPTYGQQYYNNAENANEANWVTVTAGATTPSINFSLASGANISGTITRASDGHPVQGVSVTPLDAVTGVGWFAGSSTTGADGTYTMWLPSGSYKLRANPGYTGLATQWYANAPDQNWATPLTVTEGVTTTDIDFSLPTGGNITGTITRASDGHPVSGVYVNAYDPATGEYIQGSSTTLADGTYTIWGLASGNYKLMVRVGNTGLTSQYYDNANYYTATPVAVTAGVTTIGIDFNLPACGTISGTVTRASDGQPIPNLYVYAYSTRANGVIEWSLNGPTQYDGSYSITGLPAGTYKVTINPEDSGYATQFYPGASNYDMAVPLTVTAGSTTTDIDFSLSNGGIISGTISGAGTPLQGQFVQIYHAETNELMPFKPVTNASGQYTTVGLPAGNYRIYVGGTTHYISTWYNNTFSESASTPVAVAVGNTTANVDVDLAQGAGTITGTVVRQSDSQPVAGITVSVGNTLERIRWTTTAFDGSYTLAGLPPGNTYTVWVEPRDEDYATVYYPNALTQITAASIGVTAGQTTPNINFSVSPSGSVSGVVTNLSAQPLSGLRVRAYDWASGNDGVWYAVGFSVNTQYDGSYTLTGLPTDNYKIKVFASPQDPSNEYVAQYYNNTALINSASSVGVTAGLTTTGINFSLPLGGNIAGVLTSAANAAAVPSLYVRAYDTFTGSTAAAVCQATFDGSYVLTGLPAGSYAVRAVGTGSSFADMYYNGVVAINFATPVSVTVGSTTSGINFNLLPASLLYADFTGGGLWQWNGTAWSQVNAVSPARWWLQVRSSTGTSDQVASGNGTVPHGARSMRFLLQVWWLQVRSSTGTSDQVVSGNGTVPHGARSMRLLLQVWWLQVRSSTGTSDQVASGHGTVPHGARSMQLLRTIW